MMGGDVRMLTKVPLYLAPMSGVTDLPFRLLARECGADFTITEFTSSAAISRDVADSWVRLESDDREKPFIPQIFGGVKDEMVETVQLLQGKADIIDLNFGCPATKVTRTCAGAALMGMPDDLVEMAEACVNASEVPISAKLRLGTGKGANNVVEICQRLEGVGVSQLCVHGRTLKQGYSGEANWQEIAEVVRSVSVPVIANGDIVNAKNAAQCLEITGAAGLMIGRGAIGRPMIFNQIKQDLDWVKSPPPWQKDISSNIWDCAEQIERDFLVRSWAWDRYIELCKETVGFQAKWLMRHAVSFTKGLPGAREARKAMMSDRSPEALAASVHKYLQNEYKSLLK